jgi:hypothetical protein
MDSILIHNKKIQLTFQAVRENFLDREAEPIDISIGSERCVDAPSLVIIDPFEYVV